ncbi:MAG: uridine diphosphate-N-acetylglucosamine-binding protein YvcK [Candidatus Methylomirabilia bacterium]
MARGKRLAASEGWGVVAIGGGTGLPQVLTGLKREIGSRIRSLTGVVTVTDDGGSSGRLREELKMLPPGDIRNCLVALAEVEPLMSRLFQYRFRGDGALAGHSFGNLFLAALAQVTGDFLSAIHVSAKVLAVKGTILPSTLDNVRLGAEGADGSILVGEDKLGQVPKPIRRVFLDPGDSTALPEVLEAIDQAHLVVLGPGSLFSSVIPTLLVQGVADALKSSGGLKVFVANLMTEPEETDGFTLSDQVNALVEHAGPGTVDGVLVNTRPFPERVLARYRAAGARPPRLDFDRLSQWSLWVREADLVAFPEKVRHDPRRLGRTLLELLAHGEEKRP